MCIKNRAVSLIYKILLLGLCGFGLYSYSGLPNGAFDASAFKYYTILSNLLVFLFFIFAAVYLVRRIAGHGARGYATYAPNVKGAVLMAITVTMLIYWFILAPGSFAMQGDPASGTLRNSIVHLYVPLAVLVDWLLFDRKGRWGVLAPLAWEIIPLLYWGWTILAAGLGITYLNGARYPYDFINVDTNGWPVVLRNVGLLCLAFLALGYLLWGLDRLLASFDKKTAATDRTVYNRRQGLAVPSGIAPAAGSVPATEAGFSQSLGDDAGRERLVERALAAEPMPLPGDAPTVTGAEGYTDQPGVAALAQPPEHGDAVAHVATTTMRGAGDLRQHSAGVASTHPLDEGRRD